MSKTAREIAGEICETLQWPVRVTESHKGRLVIAIEAAIIRAVKAEREACAKIAEQEPVDHPTALTIGRRIRERES